MGKKMEDTTKPYIIGETAYHHEGDIKYLYRLIDEIAELKLNAIKFHLLLELTSYYQKGHPLMKDTVNWVFSGKQWGEVIDYSRKKKLDVIALCDDVESIDYITDNKKDVYAIELHATGLNDFYLLEKASQFSGPVILGIGGSTMDEIEYAIENLRIKGKTDIYLFYGFQSYPTNYADVNLSKMLKVRDKFRLPVGYADHTGFDDPNNEVISILAAAMGFHILEKHYTPDLGKKRIDYQSAVGKEQMKRIKELFEIALTVHGTGDLGMSKPELVYGATGPMKKAIVAKVDIKKGERLSKDNLWFKRTKDEASIKQNQFFDLLGLEAKRDIESDEIIDFSMVKKE